MMTPPSVPNQIPELTRSKRFWGRVAWGAGIAVVIAPLLGMLPTIAGMLRAFREIGEQGAADSEAVAEEISFALQATMYGLGISFVSMILFAVALTIFLKRRQTLRAVEAEDR
ncbi:MotA/TolQ/ExbB proton channel family protein [Gimesia alba]|uniref:MotA/TolQ/ExbB proton channel family protein n=1 Tax=Gimesia alba TaxID=2527973 RepID=A0A517RM39_9PLAN|nr:MotA/TolQ/ExbB proton channel family protein [Gimesia alba]QDT44947.1 MotA/TolQ/ExbB proton channel family protein [Gimesia alba]